jgi:hypothetical protein
VGLSKAARSTIKTYGHPSSGRVSSEAGETKKGVPWKTTWWLGFTETQGTGDSKPKRVPWKTTCGLASLKPKGQETQVWSNQLVEGDLHESQKKNTNLQSVWPKVENLPRMNIFFILFFLFLKNNKAIRVKSSFILNN